MKETLGDPTVMNIMPWYHAYGLLSTTGSTLAGNKSITIQKFNEKVFLSAIQVDQFLDKLASME